MIIEGYGIKLRNVEEQDLEMIRVARNSAEIRSNMSYQDYITPEMQQEWFQSINSEHHNYFVILHNDLAIGLISAAEINEQRNITKNGGIFIWDNNHKESEWTLYASMLLTEVSFAIGQQENYIRIRKDNVKALHYNKLLGYEVHRDFDKQLVELILTHNSFLSKTARIRQTLDRKFGQQIKVTFQLAIRPADKVWLQLLLQLPPAQKERFTINIDNATP
ncbi:MAG: hypothetical protein LW750_05330 [Bacteroidetes bacterium]|jgi:hypothetical protein|nr:hypothetical protein [Bacteroidota bacterium]